MIEVGEVHAPSDEISGYSQNGHLHSREDLSPRKSVAREIGKRVIFALMAEGILPINDNNRVSIGRSDILSLVLPSEVEMTLRAITTGKQLIDGQRVTMAQIGIRLVKTAIPGAEIGAKVVAARIFGFQVDFFKTSDSSVKSPLV